MMREGRWKTHLHTSEKHTARKRPRAGQESVALILNSSHFNEAWKQFLQTFFGLGADFEAQKSAQSAVPEREKEARLCR